MKEFALKVGFFWSRFCLRGECLVYSESFLVCNVESRMV
jgi:hypothetical protein